MKAKIVWSRQLGLVLAGVLFGMAGWFILLGGLASLSAKCSDALGGSPAMRAAL